MLSETSLLTYDEAKELLKNEVGNIFANIEEKDEKTEVNPDGQEAV